MPPIGRRRLIGQTKNSSVWDTVVGAVGPTVANAAADAGDKIKEVGNGITNFVNSLSKGNNLRRRVLPREQRGKTIPSSVPNNSDALTEARKYAKKKGILSKKDRMYNKI